MMRPLMILSFVLASSVSLETPALAQQTGAVIVRVGFLRSEPPRSVRIDFYKPGPVVRGRETRGPFIVSIWTSANSPNRDQVIRYNANRPPFAPFSRVWVQLNYLDTTGRMRTYCDVVNYGNFTTPSGPFWMAGNASSGLQP